jgi:2-polyprenyl-3-methyl-5-hydroxy-6-metoxy-1,4-benzoquinol methylase
MRSWRRALDVHGRPLHARLGVWLRYASLALRPTYKYSAITRPLRGYTIRGERLVASWSPDHFHPHGAVDKGYYYPHHLLAKAILQSCEAESWCDLGSGVGSLVEEVARLGLDQVLAIEGSDAAIRSGLVQLPPDNYLIADLTLPMRICHLNGEPACFDVVSALELLEHVPEHKLSNLFANVCALEPKWIVFSIGLQPNPPWHVNLKSMQGWIDTISQGLPGLRYDHELSQEIFERTGKHPRFVNIYPTNQIPSYRNLLIFSRLS